MADALVSIALEKLADVVGQQLSLFAGATRELKKLSSTFESIQAILDDAESRQVRENHVQLWLSRLRHAAYDIQDLLEDGQIFSLGNQQGNEDDGNSRNKVCSCFPWPCDSPNHAVSRYNVAHGIKEIKERLDQIGVERNSFGFSSSPVGRDHSMLGRNQRQTTSLIDKSEIIGRENDKETMISRLVSGSNSDEDRGQVQVVSIFGIGGLGKTTLAQLLYRDDNVRRHFNQDLYWVCVSEPFDALRLTIDIIEEVKKAPPTRSGLNGLQEELLQLLRGKRYLLVLDDVWNDDVDKWDMLRLSLTSGANGSRILVTTRSEKVANTMNANYIHELKGLSDDQSWTLFSRRAFAGSREGDCSEFENIGKEIVKKCKGVPLSIKVTGSAMNIKRTVEDWKNILESKIWSLRQVADKILPALLLTYCHLPTYLKQCFAYCSMFPKNWEFEKDVLVKLWVAQGFIQSDGNREKEDIGDEYFDELVARSMFQQVQPNRDGKIICKMHDLLHDLAEFIAKDEIYTFISNSKGRKSGECTGSSSSSVRHAFLSFSNFDDQPTKAPIAALRAKKLRTLWLCRTARRLNLTIGGEIISVIGDLIHQARFLRALHFPSSPWLPKSIGELKHLRYLHLPYSTIAELPDAIGKMEQLRYLDLFHNFNIVELPESLSDLRNLHTLCLNRCTKLKKLPRSMVNLRHLHIEETYQLQYLPKGLDRMSGLRSLSKFIVGGGGCGIDELQPLNSLQGTLLIQHLGRVSSREEAERAQLWNKQYLSKLVLSMFAEIPGETERIDGVLEGLRPHKNLEELILIHFIGSKLPSWMDGMQGLRELVLYSGPILERLPHLPSLKKFQIEGIRNEILPDEGWDRLVSLQELMFKECGELKCLPEGLGQLKKLNSLTIARCEKFESMPDSLGRLKKLKSIYVRGSEVLRCLPDSLGQLESLQHLDIYYLKKLESVPGSLGQLKKLTRLDVGGSEVLRCLPDSIGHLESLERLYISNLKKLESVPDSLGELKALSHLGIEGSEVLASLPDSLGELKALSHLSIRRCEELASLPLGLRRLSLLEELIISDCPLLSERCKRERGVDWPNISHIPNIYVNGEWIQWRKNPR